MSVESLIHSFGEELELSHGQERYTLVMENGISLTGRAFGARKPAYGEIVFNTAMTGYQEALTDPSYRGQILMMTFPMVGNYGVHPSRNQSGTVQVEGFVVADLCRAPSQGTGLDSMLGTAGTVGLEDVDTRYLTVNLREHGTLRAAIVPDGWDPEQVAAALKRLPYPEERNLVAEVSTRRVHHIKGTGGCTVGVLDCGVKRGIIASLRRYFNVVVLPYTTPPETLMEMGLHGLLVSNGPGDPSHPEIRRTVVRCVESVASELPVMGICLGHQIIGQAFGCTTYKLKFGHRGVNHPVMNLKSGKCYITSQNHSFALHPDVPGELEVAEVNLNDGTVEGIKHTELPVFSVQYHPEGCPGPLDRMDVFREFHDTAVRWKRNAQV